MIGVFSTLGIGVVNGYRTRETDCEFDNLVSLMATTICPCFSTLHPPKLLANRRRDRELLPTERPHQPRLRSGCRRRSLATRDRGCAVLPAQGRLPAGDQPSCLAKVAQ